MTSLNPTQAILQRLAELRQRLTVAAAAFDKSAPDAGRSTLHIVLGSLDAFMAAMLGTKNPQVLIPLRQLRYALHDLDRGKVVPLLTPRKVKGRPRDAADEEGLRAFGAASMELFIKGGIARKEAARRVAATLHGLGYREPQNERITPQDVEGWRDRLRSERPADNVAAGRFHRMTTTSHHPSQDPILAAKLILQHIPRVAPPAIPKKPPT